MDIWCEDCGAEQRNQCYCPETVALPQPEREDRWVGMDGHAYVGDKSRPSLAYHDTDNCRCPGSANFDPDSWY